MGKRNMINSKPTMMGAKILWLSSRAPERCVAISWVTGDGFSRIRFGITMTPSTGKFGYISEREEAH